MAADAILATLDLISKTIPIPAVGIAVKAAICLIEMCQVNPLGMTVKIHLNATNREYEPLSSKQMI